MHFTQCVPTNLTLPNTHSSSTAVLLLLLLLLLVVFMHAHPDAPT
jgi:hypothetical protein